VNELALTEITTLEAANRYLLERFMPDYNEEFARPPADATVAFLPLHGVDLDGILCEQEERIVTKDNVVALETMALQLAKHPAARRVRDCGSPSAATSMARSRSGTAPVASAATTRRVGL
jgi:hypothetical protein